MREKPPHAFSSSGGLRLWAILGVLCLVDASLKPLPLSSLGFLLSLSLCISSLFLSFVRTPVSGFGAQSNPR